MRRSLRAALAALLATGAESRQSFHPVSAELLEAEFLRSESGRAFPSTSATVIQMCVAAVLGVVRLTFASFVDTFYHFKRTSYVCFVCLELT